MSPLVLALAIGLAGGVGSLMRWATDVVITHRAARAEHSAAAAFPWALLLVNVVGSFVCGFATAHWGIVEGGMSEWGLILATGLAGGLTTMSTLAVSASGHLGDRKLLTVALWNLALHLILGVTCAWLGIFLGAI